MNTFCYKIYYEDTDAGGVVYYANYLKFLERARTDFLLSRGISQVSLIKDNTFFVVKSCHVEYLASAVLEDTLSVSCTIVKQTKTSIIFEQKITTKKKDIIYANVKIVCVSRKHNIFKPVKIPKNIVDSL